MNQNFLVPVDGNGTTFNHVQVQVSHDSHRKSVLLTMYPAEVKDGITILAITQGKYLNTDPMPRKNQKKLDDAFNKAKQEINTKNGPAYSALLELCKERKLSLKS
jgi:hypothetical protein